MPEDQRETGRRFQVLHHAYRTGDLAGVRAALGEPADFPNCIQPREFGCGDHPLEYAIYWSPLSFVARLLDAGADPNYHDPAGFPSLMAALSTDRTDRAALVALLLARGAEPAQRGNNDWTPLHYAVARRDLDAIRLLLAHGADPLARTGIDDRTTPLEDAEAAGFTEGATLIRGAGPR
jgi:hypothetical protein